MDPFLRFAYSPSLLTRDCDTIFAGCAISFALKPSTFLSGMSQKHGDVFTVYMMGEYFTFVNRMSFLPCFYKSLNFYGSLKRIQLEDVLGPHAIVFRAEDTMHLMRQRLPPVVGCIYAY